MNIKCIVISATVNAFPTSIKSQLSFDEEISWQLYCEVH